MPPSNQNWLTTLVRKLLYWSFVIHSFIHSLIHSSFDTLIHSLVSPPSLPTGIMNHNAERVFVFMCEVHFLTFMRILCSYVGF